MSKKDRRIPRETRPPEPSDKAEQTYTLEEIMNEFGGWSTRAPEPQPEPEPEAAPLSEPESDTTEEPPAEAPEAEAEPAAPMEQETPARASRFHFVNLDLNAPPEPEMPEEPEKPEVWSWQSQSEPEKITLLPEKPAPEAPVRAERARRKAAQPEKREAPKRRTPVSAAAGLRHYRGRSAFTRLRAIFLTLLTLAAVFLTLAPLLHVAAFEQLGSSKAVPMVLLVLMSLCALACIDLVIRAISQLLTLRPGLELLLTVSFAACTVDAVSAMLVPRVPNCAVVCVGFLFAAWSEYLTCVGAIRSLRVAAEGEEHYALMLARGALGSLDCAFKTKEETPDFVELLEAPGRTDAVMRVYVPLVLVMAVVFSVVCRVRAEVSFARALSCALCAGLPVCGFVCYTRPFAHVAKRLSRSGAALCGWTAAKTLGGELGVVITDSDLYPNGSVSINGVKVYNDFRYEQLVCYAATAIAQSGSALTPLFEKLAAEQGVSLAEVGSFRSYEGGGIGAEIRGDIVLVGLNGFMHLMGVRIPQGANIRQAVYVAVNGVIAGVIAINYKPNSPVISALSSTVRRGVSIVGATRDFLISPAMLHAKFHIPTTRAEFPPVAERYRLSELGPGDSLETAAVLSRGTVLPYCEALAGARSLRESVTLGLAIGVFGGLFGLLMVFFLCLGGAVETASALNLLLFALIWTVPGLLITMWAKRF